MYYNSTKNLEMILRLEKGEEPETEFELNVWLDEAEALADVKRICADVCNGKDLNRNLDDI